ncbi:DNA cytosine methyltransferase [Brevibacillus fluminis]|uniref:DNA cytosine methyltransferase n=1 Tax=Brevibacillus fluminis TaxID=511487 RepID=UPI0026D01358
MLENVEEFKTWGPLLKDGMPDPDKKGRTFQAFVNALKRQGYQVEWRELRACDYGAPTIRKRFFLIARRDGRPIVWPEPTHGDPNSPEVKSGKLKPWRTAAEIIDWSLPCPSIFERKKPLAENTQRRIARGVQKFIIDNPDPFLAPISGSVSFVTKFRTGATGHPVTEPLHTITSGAGSKRPAGAAHAMGLVTAFIGRQFGQSTGHSAEEPLGTITAGGMGKSQLVAAFLAQYHSETASHEARGQTMDRPILTLDTSNRYALVTSNLIKMRGTNIGQPVTGPLQTVTAGGNHFGEVRAFLMKYYGAGIGQECSEPLHTIPTKDRFGLVTIHGQDYQIVDIGMRMLEPHELFAAQGFPNSYIIKQDADGKSYPKSEQVARCGNSVPPPFANALVRANLPEHCASTGNVATFERYKEQPVGQQALSI